MSVVRVCPKCSAHTPRGYFACTECGRSLSGVPEIDPSAPVDTSTPTAEMPAAAQRSPQPTKTFTVIRGVDIPFGELVWLLVKIGLAAVPAAIILGVAWAVGMTLIGGALLRSAVPY